MNEVEIIERDIMDLAPVEQQGQSGGLLTTSADTILQLAERADRYIDAMNRIMDASLKITSEHDWVVIGGKPYLQESGATKVARLFGISIQLIGRPIVECDVDGYKTFTYRAKFSLGDQYVECDGSRSAKEDFFAGSGKKTPRKKPDEIDDRDVKMSAYTNCINNGIKRLIPNLRNIDLDTLERAGLDTSKIQGYTFRTGSQGGRGKSAEESGIVCADCGQPITQKVASYSESKFGRPLCMDCQKKGGA